MRIDCKYVLKAFDGETTLKYGGRQGLICPHCNKEIIGEAKDLTIGTVITEALLTPKKGDDALPQDKKLAEAAVAKEAWLAEKSENGVMELSAGDLRTIKDAAGKIFPKLVLFQFCEYLDSIK